MGLDTYTTYVRDPLVLIPNDIFYRIDLVIVWGDFVLINDLSNLLIRKSSYVVRALHSY